MELAYAKKIDKYDAILPIGSIEQHGKHLPYATDSIIAEEIARNIADRLSLYLLPCIYYGLSQEHDPLFNISISNQTLANLIYDISNSLAEHGFKRLFIINGHYGNTSLLESLPKMIDSIKVYVLSYWLVIDKDIGHADEIETSLMLAIKSELVDMDNVAIGKVKVEDKLLLSRLTQLRGSLAKISNGVIGDARNASKDKGYQLLQDITDRLAKIIKDLMSY